MNFPMRDGIDDESYQNTFVPIVSKVMESYQPSAVVLQCGADSLSGDRLGCFNLTLKGNIFLFTYLVWTSEKPDSFKNLYYSISSITICFIFRSRKMRRIHEKVQFTPHASWGRRLHNSKCSSMLDIRNRSCS